MPQNNGSSDPVSIEYFLWVVCNFEKFVSTEYGTMTWLFSATTILLFYYFLSLLQEYC